MKAFKGDIIHCNTAHTVEYHEQSWLCVMANGKIRSIQIDKPIDAREYNDFGKKLIIPGLIDTHTHLPQYSFAGLGNLPLLPWLEKYTFPQEMRFANSKVARTLADIFFKDLLSHGTTSVIAYATAHKEATETAFQSAIDLGIRAHIGQVWMNRNAPQEMLLSPDTAYRQSEEILKWYHGKNGCEFVVTPRFAVSCSREMLEMSGALRKEYNLLLQSHLSENKDEINSVLKLFPDCAHYTEVYEKTGILSDKTLLGHSIYLAKDEKEILKESGTILVHCPTSNRFLGSGIMPLRNYLSEKQKVTLGTDVAAGFTLSMFHEMKEAIESSKQFHFFQEHKNLSAISPEEAFALATICGAEAMGKADSLGNFSEEKYADFIVVDDMKTHPEGNTSVLYASMPERLSRLLYRYEKGMVKKTFIAGKLVHECA